MTQTQSATPTLDRQAALACRLIRSETIWTEYHQWLARPTRQTPPPRSPAKQVVESLDQLLKPLRTTCSDAEQHTMRLVGPWIASACELIIAKSDFQLRDWTTHLLAAGLMPLYRSLATGHWEEGFLQCRRRLSEGLILQEIIAHLDLQELLELTVNTQVSPHRVLLEQFEIDLTQLDHLIFAARQGFDGAKKQITPEAARILRDYQSRMRLPNDYQTPEWADPQTLWVLSNELLSERSDLVLPRSWIDTPVPWGKITEHWHNLKQLLNSAISDRTNNCDIAYYPAMSMDTVLAVSDELSKPLENSMQNIESVDQAIDRELRGGQTDNAPSREHRKPIPKILIGEISGLDDAAFQNVVKRRIAVCRSEARSVCLSMLVVQPDSDLAGPSPLNDGGGGFSRWHLKIVNWLAEHPSMKEPVAFVTREGLLIIAVLDVERNEMTTILRQGLIEVLTGNKDDSAGSLCQVHIPAKFHVGVASTAAPSASFDSQEIIDSAHRCFTVAQRLGKASIKSIEVY